MARIDINVSVDSMEELHRILGQLLGSGNAAPEPAPAPSHVLVGIDATGRGGELTGKRADTVIADDVVVESEPSTAAHKVGEPVRGPDDFGDDQRLAELVRGRKPTQTTNDRDGNPVRAGDEVTTIGGGEAVVEVTLRGAMILRYPDGSLAEVSTKEIMLTAQEDTTEAPAAVNGATPSLEAVRSLLGRVSDEVSKTAASEVLRVVGVKKLSTMTPAELRTLHEAAEARLAEAALDG